METTYFENILYAAYLIGELDWSKQFIALHKQYVNKAFYEKAYLLFSCQILYKEKKYNEALSRLEKIDFKGFAFALRKFTLRIQCIYEKYGNNASFPIEELTEKFRHYVNGQKKQGNVGPLLQEKIKNTSSLVKKMTKVDHITKYTQEYLTKELEKHKGKILEEKWFARMIREIVYPRR